MEREFKQIEWDSDVWGNWRTLVALAIREDLGESGDPTTQFLVPAGARGDAALVARSAGVVAGLPAAEMVLREIDPAAQWNAEMRDGQSVAPGDVLARISGNARALLVAERLMLNVLSRLSGIATLTRSYVEAVSNTSAKIYDTRKTTPGWRLLEKYAVRCGGGHNHRTGLFEAVLIKDNHLALGASGTDSTAAFSTAEAVRRVRAHLEQQPDPRRRQMIVEVEVDTLEQLEEVLAAQPDIVLLDNMEPDQLRQAVALRDARNPQVELEASGGVRLETVRAIALAGVGRISVGALTHSARALDIGLDWR